VLGFYALSQQLPALFAPEPFLASVLALVRTLLIFGLIGLGAGLRQSGELRWLGLGVGLVCVTALIFSVTGGGDPLVHRLRHPYMTSVTVGLAGALGIWLSLFGWGKLMWRIPLGLLALSVLLLSGSRGPLAAALVGSVLGMMVKRQRRGSFVLIAGTALLLGGFYLGQRLEVSTLTRLASVDTSGRDIIWYNTLSVIRGAPWSGVGSYRLGERLTPPESKCELFTSPTGGTRFCPPWAKRLGNPWLMAHNVSLQQLAESGPLGLLGLFVLLGVVTSGTLQTRDPLSMAVLGGLLLATVNDNTILVPSPFFAEVFWVVAGMQLVGLQRVGWRSGLLSTGLMSVLSIPLFSIMRPAPSAPAVYLTFLSAPVMAKSYQDYTVYMQLKAPPGRYRVILQSCVDSCSSLMTFHHLVEKDIPPMLQLQGRLQPVARQQLELLLYSEASTTGLRPLARRTWTVEVKP